MFNIMQENNVQLDHFVSMVDPLLEPMEETLTNIQQAQSVSGVSSLAFYCKHSMNNPLFSTNFTTQLVDLVPNLNHLIRLKIDSDYFDSYSPISLMDILENLLTLESLDFYELSMCNETDDRLYDKVTNSNTIISTRLESISLLDFCVHAKDHQDGNTQGQKLNILF